MSVTKAVAADLVERAQGSMGRHAGRIGVVLVVGIVAAVRDPAFLTVANIFDILRSTSTLFLVCCPLALLVILGGFDFSVGATYTVGAIVATKAMEAGLFWPLGILLGIAVAAFAGWVTGMFVTRLGIVPIIATLAMFFIASGLVNVFVKGLVAPLPPGFLMIGQGELFGIPLLFYYAAIAGTVFGIALDRTALGYALKAIGGNREAALATGIPVSRIELWLYVASGATAALAGIIYAARTSAASPDAGGFPLALQALTAVLIGGVSLAGGTGPMGGVAWGTVLLSEIDNALGVARVDQVWSDVIIGCALISAVLADQRRRRKQLAADTPTRTSRASVARIELPRVLAEFETRSQSRVATAIDEERLRIQRDLHDGTQVHVLNAALRLQMAADRVQDSDDPTIASMLHDGVSALQRALSDIRATGRGLPPGVLADVGLAGAVEQLAKHATIPVSVHAEAMPSVPMKAELAAYFLVSEALTNTLRHAGASWAEIRIQRVADQLEVVVADDGVGGAKVAEGSGLAGLKARLDAIGGELVIASVHQRGTTVIGRLPLFDAASVPG